VELMDRLSRRKDANRVEGAECQKMMADRDFAGPPVCRKILRTVKVVSVNSFRWSGLCCKICAGVPG